MSNEHPLYTWKVVLRSGSPVVIKATHLTSQIDPFPWDTPRDAPIVLVDQNGVVFFSPQDQIVSIQRLETVQE